MAMLMAGRKIHILAIPFPHFGHRIALLQLCRILTTSNPDIVITFLNADLHGHTLVQNLYPHHSLNISFASLDLTNLPKKPQSMGWTFLRYILSIIDELEVPTRHFVSAKLKRKPDFILSDVYIGWAQGMASQLGIPHIALWTSSASECLVYHYVPTLIARYVLPFKVPEGRSMEKPDSMTEEMGTETGPAFHQIVVGSKDDIVVDIPGLPPLHRGEFPSLLQIENEDDILFHGFIKQASQMAKADLVLLNTFYDLETRIIEELKKEVRVVPIGPLFLMDKLHEYNNKEEEMKKVEGVRECLEWLDQKPKGSVVYVAFGSILKLRESQVLEIAAGLEACGHPFLWSLIKESSPLPNGFLERCKDRGRVVDWVPQTLVLDHPAVGVFLSHCGWNSSLESLALGVPLICCPRVTDQFLNAKMIVDEWGLGLRVAAEGNFLTAEGLAFAVKQLLNNNDIGSSYESKTRGCAIKAKAQALHELVSKDIGSTSNLDETLHCPSAWEALHSLLEFIGTHGKSE